MNLPPKGFPEQLRTAGATDLERRLLTAASREMPACELRERMAQAIGVSSAAILPGAGAATTGNGAAETLGASGTMGGSAPGVTAGLGTVLPWVSAGLVAAGLAAAVVFLRPDAKSKSEVEALSPSVSLAATNQATPPTPSEVAPKAAVDFSPTVEAPPPPQRSRVGTSGADLRNQIALVDSARAALAVGTSERTLELVRQYQSKYPNGSFRPEAAALKIEALAKLGRNTEARVLAERFAAEHRGTPLGDRVVRIVGLKGDR